MVEIPSSSSSSSSASFSSFDDVSVKNNSSTVKFLCSYGGKILPRYPDGKLRYFGGHTRVLAVDRSVPFSELMVKLLELCGWEKVSLRCQLPTDDLDALISITSDEDLVNLFEEYDLANKDKLVPLKVRAFLYEVKPLSPSTSPKSVPPLPQISSGSRPCVNHHHHRQHPRVMDHHHHHHRHHHHRQEHHQEDEIFKNREFQGNKITESLTFRHHKLDS